MTFLNQEKLITIIYANRLPCFRALQAHNVIQERMIKALRIAVIV